MDPNRKTPAAPRRLSVRRWLPWGCAAVGICLWLSGAQGDPTDPVPSGLQIGGALAVVVGVLWAMPEVLQRVQKHPLAGGRRIELLEARAMGRRRRLLLVKVEGKTILLGESEAGWARLEAWDTAGHRFERELTSALEEIEG